MAEADDVFAFEAERWEREGWTEQRDRHIGRLKGQHAQLTSRRITNFAWATSVLPHVKAIYDELDLDEDETIGGTKLAAALSARGILTQKGVKPTTLSDVGKAWADALIHETDAALVREAVLECRTAMTARCLSADFDTSELGTLEAKYVEIIADILALGRALRHQPPLSRDELHQRALNDARAEAREQRSKKPTSMAVRERFWRDRPPPVRKIFEEEVER